MFLTDCWGLSCDQCVLFSESYNSCWQCNVVMLKIPQSGYVKSCQCISQRYTCYVTKLTGYCFFFFDEVVTESFLWNWFFFLFYLILSCKQSISVICRIYALRCSDAQTSWTVWAFYKAACTCVLHCMRQINVAMMFVQVLVHRWQKSDP